MTNPIFNFFKTLFQPKEKEFENQDILADPSIPQEAYGPTGYYGEPPLYWKPEPNTETLTLEEP